MMPVIFFRLDPTSDFSLSRIRIGFFWMVGSEPGFFFGVSTASGFSSSKKSILNLVKLNPDLQLSLAIKVFIGQSGHD